MMEFSLFSHLVINSDTSANILSQILIFNFRALMVLSCCFLTIRIVKGSAAIQHLLIAVAIGSILLLPISSQFAPSFEVVVNTSEIASIANPAFTANVSSNTFVIDMISAIFVVVYCIGVVSLTLRVILRNLEMMFLVNVCQPVDQSYWKKALSRYRRRIGIRREIRILHSRLVTSPATWGVFRPVILLPSNAVQWPDHLISSTVLHELAHIKRFDWLVQQVARLICAFYWVNPFCWKALNKLCINAETACDDMTINAGIMKTHYANNLVNVAEHVLMNQKYNFAALAMAVAIRNKHSQLHDRVIAILNPDRYRCSMTRLQVVFALLAFLCVFLPLASMRANYVERIEVSETNFYIDGGQYGQGAEAKQTEGMNPDALIPQVNSPEDAQATPALKPSTVKGSTKLPIVGKTAQIKRFSKEQVIARLKTDLSEKWAALNQPVEKETPKIQTGMQAVLEEDAVGDLRRKELGSKPTFEAELVTALERLPSGDIVLNHSWKNMVIPKYPNKARYQGIEGEVTVKYSIDELGNVTDATIVSAQPMKIFDRHVLKAIKRSTFTPRMVNGQAVPATGLLEKYVFVLNS